VCPSSTTGTANSRRKSGRLGGRERESSVNGSHTHRTLEFAFTDFESLETYGEPNEALREWIPRVSEGIPFTHHPVHWGGFTRLQAVTPN
jgi:hypothetical protein